MSDIDQAAIIEQLMSENKLLRETLRQSPDKEIQIAAALSMVIDELTRMGPHTTGRVLDWIFLRYGIQGSVLVHSSRDRRPKLVEPSKQEAPQPARRHLLRQARVGAGLTQAALAERTGIAAPRISQIELGNTRPSEEVWQRLENGIKGETP